MQKRGPLKFLTLGAPEKNYHRFSIKNWVYMLFYGLTHNFHGKKGGPEFFLQSEGGPEKFLG